MLDIIDTILIICAMVLFVWGLVWMAKHDDDAEGRANVPWIILLWGIPAAFIATHVMAWLL